MRSIAILVALLPSALTAEVLTLPSRATEAIVYPVGGQITHEVAVSLDVGRHQIVLPDMPPNLVLNQLRVSAPGLRLGALRYRQDITPPRQNTETTAVTAAKQTIKDIERQIQAVRDTIARNALDAQAAEDRISFLSALGSNDSLPADPDSLRAIARMISDETRAARQTILETSITARDNLDQITQLEDTLDIAKAALDALIPEAKDRPWMVLDVVATQQLTNSPVRISYVTDDAMWAPTYTIRLSDNGTPRVELDRGADVTQYTGENWTGIALTVSTQSPGAQIDPSMLWPDKRRLFDPADLQRQRSQVLQTDSATFAAPSADAPEIVEEISTTQIGTSGLAVTYTFSDPVNIASDADAVRIPFDTLSLPATLSARAVPYLDNRAYLVATVTNTSAEPLLPAYDSLRFYQDSFVGSTEFPEIASGAQADLGFGPIAGLQLKRTILNRAESDRGLISRSNEQTEDIRITVENLTDQAWSMDLRDRVPFSEQEDLRITYSATPKPDTDALDDRRGILQWTFPLSAGGTKTLNTSTKITWPEGQHLR